MEVPGNKSDGVWVRGCSESNPQSWSLWRESGVASTDVYQQVEGYLGAPATSDVEQEQAPRYAVGALYLLTKEKMLL